MLSIGPHLGRDHPLSNVGFGEFPCLGIKPKSLASLAEMIETGQISASSSAPVFEAMVLTGKEPDILAQQLNLIQKSDAGELEKVIDQVLADNPDAVEDVISGGKKSQRARGFLLGQVMQKTKGQANPKIVAQILDKKPSVPFEQPAMVPANIAAGIIFSKEKECQDGWPGTYARS